MEYLVVGVLMYLAIGAACFAHPSERAEPQDFHWRDQIAIFLDTFPAVLTWPLVLWRLYAAR
jgi:hypothetical protein